MGRRVLILAAGIGSGHNIAAGVLESCFRAAPEVDVVQKLDILESTNEVYRDPLRRRVLCPGGSRAVAGRMGLRRKRSTLQAGKMDLALGSHQHHRNRQSHQGLPP